MNKRNEFITFSKGLAIITIVLFHFTKDLHLPNPILKLVNLGGGGVHLFLFASGFGLAMSSYNGYITFLRKRFSKVLVPYYLTISFIFLLNCLLSIYPHDIHAYLSHIFLYKMFVESWMASFGAQFWFISTILQFYILYPIINSFVNRVPIYSAVSLSLFISIAYSIIVAQIGLEEIRVWNSFFLQYLWEFVLGMVIAKSGALEKVVQVKTWKWLLIALVSYSLMYLLVMVLGAVGRNINDVFSFLGYTSMVLVVYKLCGKYVKKLILWIEPFSYSLFLVHYFVYDFFKVKINHGDMSVENLPVVVFLALLIAYGYNLMLTRFSPRQLKLPLQTIG